MTQQQFDDAAFERETLRVGSVTETPHPVHEGMGLWIFRLVKGMRCPPVRPFKRSFEFYCLSHMFDGKGFLWLPPAKGVAALEPGDGIIMPPGQAHAYGGLDGFFFEDAICFVGPVADTMFRNGLLRPGVTRIGLERRLLPVIDLAQDPAPLSQIKAAVALESLLLELASENRQSGADEAETRILALLESLKLAPGKWWTVEEMAASCRLSVAQFRRRFSSLVGMQPKRYVEILKMRCAAADLARGVESVAEVASRYSYGDQYHFSRRFKQVMGVSPKRFSIRPFGDFKAPPQGRP